VLGKMTDKGKKLYCNAVCHWAHETERILGPTGSFRPLIEEYMRTAAANYYAMSTTYAVRTSLAKFFRHAAETEHLTDLDQIRPGVITRFIAVERERGLTSRNFVGHLATLFNWLIAEERYHRPNPVVSRIHSQKNAPAQPRPYTDHDLGIVWGLVEASRRPELLLAMAIGEECGLRIGEVCNIRLSDVDQSAQKIFVRLPTKGKCTRTVPYHDKVRKYLKLWLEVRDPTCRYDHVLHNSSRTPFITTLLDFRFAKLLCGEPDPGGSFSFHRLRHSWATRLMNNGMELAVLKVLGGWESWSSMQRYIQVLDSTVRRQYEETYQKLQEQAQAESDEILSLLDFAALEAGAASTTIESST
jgi:integrase